MTNPRPLTPLSLRLERGFGADLHLYAIANQSLPRLDIRPLA
ncbi:hypothetical protein HMPREF0322_04572 [Desulfitobacterium hafniense DP7]|uniref:Uncharacterized protein n=1 Tax=Desulfitobacterium hafniense DP7 TaxID=537010 RepID=G9XUB4_DESHA|nr:hypothetical protein HMPREF0322_04572 [Desulfitobacterium hafniense DP7]